MELKISLVFIFAWIHGKIITIQIWIEFYDENEGDTYTLAYTTSNAYIY